MSRRSKRGTSSWSSQASRGSHPEGRSGGDLAPLDLARAFRRPRDHHANTFRLHPAFAIAAPEGADLPHVIRAGDLRGSEYGTAPSRRRPLERQAWHAAAGVLSPWLHRVLEVCTEGVPEPKAESQVPLPGASSTARMASDATRAARWTEERGDRH
jgi:hypothetical protein